MSRLWVPTARAHRPKVSREHEEGTKEWEAAVLSMMHQEGGIIDHWNPVLAKIDPKLRLMQATALAEEAGVLPGYYHLVRLNEGAPMWVQALTGPSGEFIEPTDAMLRGLRAADLQNPTVVRDRQRTDEVAARRKKRDEANEDEDRVQDTIEHWDAVSRTQIPMSPEIAWTQNWSATARRARAEKQRRG
jgi:hypothetical protein